MLALFRSYSLVLNLCSLSVSACRMLCCNLARSRLRSVKESAFETLRRGVIGACVSRAMILVDGGAIERRFVVQF